MIPQWITNKDEYQPVRGNNSFILKTIKSLGNVLSRVRIQRGHEKKRALPALVKLLCLFVFIVVLSVTQNKLVILAFTAVIQVYLCIWPAKDIASILKPSLVAGVIALILFIPAMIINTDGITNNLIVVAKVFLSVEMVSIFNHTSQWNHITSALKKLHIPGIFIFTLDITLKYIVLLGTLITDLLTSLHLRSVGKNSKKYQSIGGVMGVTFVRSAEMSKEMYEAMQCRGFTDDYKGL